jgi:hypothetical protein
MVEIMNLFNNLMTLSPHDNNGDLQPLVISYPKYVYLHQ